MLSAVVAECFRHFPGRINHLILVDEQGRRELGIGALTDSLLLKFASGDRIELAAQPRGLAGLKPVAVQSCSGLTIALKRYVGETQSQRASGHIAIWRPGQIRGLTVLFAS